MHACMHPPPHTHTHTQRHRDNIVYTHTRRGWGGGNRERKRRCGTSVYFNGKNRSKKFEVYIWKRTRPRALVQNEHTRELISAWIRNTAITLTSMRVNTRYINSTRGACSLDGNIYIIKRYTRCFCCCFWGLVQDIWRRAGTREARHSIPGIHTVKRLSLFTFHFLPFSLIVP